MANTIIPNIATYSIQFSKSEKLNFSLKTDGTKIHAQLKVSTRVKLSLRNEISNV